MDRVIRYTADMVPSTLHYLVRVPQWKFGGAKLLSWTE